MSVVYHSQKEMLKIIVFAVFMMFYVKKSPATLLILILLAIFFVKYQFFSPTTRKNYFQQKLRYGQIIIFTEVSYMNFKKNNRIYWSY